MDLTGPPRPRLAAMLSTLFPGQKLSFPFPFHPVSRAAKTFSWRLSRLGLLLLKSSSSLSPKKLQMAAHLSQSCRPPALHMNSGLGGSVEFHIQIYNPVSRVQGPRKLSTRINRKNLKNQSTNICICIVLNREKIKINIVDIINTGPQNQYQ